MSRAQRSEKVSSECQFFQVDKLKKTFINICDLTRTDSEGLAYF